MQSHRKKELGLWLPPHIFTIYSWCLQPAQLPPQIRDVVAQLLEPSPSSVCVLTMEQVHGGLAMWCAKIFHL